MYYSDEHIKDLSTYKTPRPAFLRLFPLSPQFCCEKVMKHWRSSAESKASWDPRCVFEVSFLSGRSPFLIATCLLISLRFWINGDHYYLLKDSIQNSKRLQKNIVLKRPETDFMTRTSGCRPIFFHEAIRATQREKSRTFLFQPAIYFTRSF